jgi:glycosyltransferase involved in cell wall biosynthesis
MGANAAGSRERVMFRLAGRLVEMGVDVDIVAPAPSAAWRDGLPAGVRLVDLAGPLTRRLPNLVRIMLSPPALARYFRDARPDIAMTLSIPTALAGLTAARRAKTGVKIVVRQSNVVHIKGSERYGGVDRRFRDPLIRRLYPKAAAIIGVSEGVADNLTKLGGIKPERIHAVPNGILLDEVDRLAAEPVNHPWFEESQTRPIITAVGRLVPKKDYPTLLRAFVSVREKQNARLLVLGEGKERKRLEALSRDLGLAEDVDLIGRVANPFAYLAHSSLYVLSSTYEGMPSALIEALACGCPAVSTDCPAGPSEILENGRYGRLVPIGDVDELAHAIQDTLATPPPRERQIARARQFGAERTVNGYVEVLERVLRAGH